MFDEAPALRRLRLVWTPLVLVGALALVVCLTTAFGGLQLQLTVTEMLIRVAIVVGIYIFCGTSGVLSFGHIGFLCIGAYAAGWATTDPQWKQMMLTGLPSLLQDHRYPMPVAVLFGGLVAALAALVFGLPIMRLTGIAASIATFSFLVIVQSVYASWDSVTGGTGSITGVPTVIGPWSALLFAAAAIAIAYPFQTSGSGLMLRASREDEVAAAASAIAIPRLRLAAFVLSGFLVGAAGGVHAHFVGILTTDAFYLDLTFITIAMLIVGGIGSLTGAVLGVAFLTLVIDLFRRAEAGIAVGGAVVAFPPGVQEIALGVIMALTLVFRPEGIMGGREAPFPFRAGRRGSAPGTERSAPPCGSEPRSVTPAPHEPQESKLA